MYVMSKNSPYHGLILAINGNEAKLLSKQMLWATCQCHNVIYILLYLLVLSPQRVPGDIDRE